MAWSFYAGSIGCWALFLPASYPAFGGWVSVCTYAFSTGLPVLLIAEFGYKLMKRVPEVMSLNDFAGRMYGRPVQAAVAALSLVRAARWGRAGLVGVAFVGPACSSSARRVTAPTSIAHLTPTNKTKKHTQVNMAVALISEYTAIGTIKIFI